MRKRCKRVIRHASPPMLVSFGLAPPDIEARERMFVEAFAGGWAGKDHFDQLTDMRNILTIAAAEKDDEETLSMCEAMRIVMMNVRIRFEQVKKFGVSGDELTLMRTFIDVYRDFWLRQPTRLFHDSVDALDRHWKLVDQQKERMAA